MANIAKVSKALSDKNRIMILQMLSEGETTVGTVAENLNVEENLASHHLRVLAAVGFLKNHKKGREVFYRLNTTRLVTLFKDMSKNPAFKEILQESLKK